MNFQLTYKGKNNFGGYRFSVSEKQNPDDFKRLTKLCELIEDKKFETSLPIYKHSMEYISITCKRSLHAFRTCDLSSVFNVQLQVYQKDYGGKHYISLEVVKVKLVKKMDKGKIVSDVFSV